MPLSMTWVKSITLMIISSPANPGRITLPWICAFRSGTPKPPLRDRSDGRAAFMIPGSAAGRRSGEESENEIDDRLDDSLQISTIIHELAHFLLFDVSVNFLCEILDVKESSLIKSFIEYFLTVPEIEIINEYCAHTVENRFIPLEFQNFRSFEKCVMDMGLGMEDIVDFIILGNSYANDFIHFLERPINEKLRQSIKLQFKRDFIDSKKEIVSYADSRLFPIEEKNRLFIGLMAYSFESLYANEEARFELEHIRIKFED